MKVITKRALALLMSLMLMVSLFVGLAVPAHADSGVYDINYKTSGKYIYNWGTRGTVANKMSPNAVEFYKDNGVTFEQLAAYAGNSSTSSVSTSNLFKQLNTLMYGSITYKTSYDATRDLFKYTDCQNNGSPNTISSFYSGKAIGPNWDSGATWNREHCWPNSKSNGGSNSNTVRETDIMMLRPASVSENSSRGNKAYGKSSGYYNPNGESNGQYDLRGDVARIVLYVYVCWGGSSDHDGALNYMWGSSGVIESKAVLLEWMEADPVDTWELARNDSVESITGTRNVFVDYPELAFELFETETPTNWTTPSGNASGGNVTNDPSQPDIPTVNPDVPSVEGVITNPEVGVAYKFGMVQENVSTSSVYYLKGGMGTPEYYMATDTSVDAAIDVYLEQANGGYYLYTNYSGSKQYINMVVNDTHVNGKYEATASTIYTYDADAQTIVATVNDDVYWFGTRNDNTYTTVGPVKKSYNGFYCKLYSANGAATPDTPDVPAMDEPAANSTLTVAEAATLGNSKSKDTYTAGKYYVTGTIKAVDNATFGNMTITDGNGNNLYVYGTYNNDGTVGYSALNPKPVVGDTITLYGVIGMYNEAQMKSGWIVSYIPGANPDQPSVAGSAKIDFSSTANRTNYSTSQQVWEQNGITVTNDKASSTQSVGDFVNPGRFYKGSNVTITYPGMKKIVITGADGSAYQKDYVGPWADSFSDSNATADVNGFEVTITFTNPVDSFTWTSMTGQARAYFIEVFDGSEDTSHTHEYTNACDADCNTCGAVRIANHTYDDDLDATCNVCGDAREVVNPDDIKCTHQYDNACDKTCNKCDEERTVGAHKYSNACDKDCNECGATRTVGAHKYDNACDADCNECGATRTIKHDYKAATCTKAKTCKICGVTSGSKLGHSYKTVTTKATTSKNGSVKKTCSKCGYVSSTSTIYKASKISLSKTSYTYNGKAQKPSVVVKDSKGKTISSKYYTVTYASGRKNVGKYKVTIKMKGNYSGTKTLYFTINPVKTSLKTITPAKKALTVKWTKKTSQVTGYQIQYSTTKNFKSYKTKTISKNSTTSVKLTGLSANKAYYVRVRTYKTVNGTKYYSGWSTIMYKKTK